MIFAKPAPSKFNKKVPSTGRLACTAPLGEKTFLGIGGLVKIGSSYMANRVNVALTSLIVTVICKALPIPDGAFNVNAVSEIHIVLLHTEEPSLDAGEDCCAPNIADPVKVRICMPMVWMLIRVIRFQPTFAIRAVSYVSASVKVMALTPIVTTNARVP